MFGVDDVALIALAKAAGVPCDSLAEKWCIKKVWALCTEAFTTGRHSQPASQTEQDDLVHGPPTLSIAQDRVEQLSSMIRDVLESGKLTPAMAGKLWGRLGFSCTQMFGRFGRANLRPFSRRQHEHRQFWLNHQLTSSLRWWLQILSCSPPRLVPTDLSARRRIVSKSDGEGSKANIGVA